MNWFLDARTGNGWRLAPLPREFAAALIRS